MKQRKNRKEKKKGFTLVELIVVLVILAILAAIMVPALLGWIERAKNQDAILQCRSVVMAAQGQVAEEYGKGSQESLGVVMNKEITRKEIVEMAGADGKIRNSSIILNAQQMVTNLVYTTAKSIIVVYDRSATPVYRVQESGKYADNVPGYMDQVADIGDDKKSADYFLDKNSGKVKGEYGKYFSHETEAKDNESKRLQVAYLEQYGEFEPVDWDQINFPSGVTFNDGILPSAVWKPIVTKEGEIILVADVLKGIGAARASIIYYNGTYYYHRHSAERPDKISNDFIGERKGQPNHFSIETNLLKSGKWTKFPN